MFGFASIESDLALFGKYSVRPGDGGLNRRLVRLNANSRLNYLFDRRLNEASIPAR
jgi:hypothetical protein